MTEYGDLPTRTEELKAALRPFVEAAEKWSARNHSGWRDDEAGILDAAGRPVEWLAEIEVSNRDVLAARAALYHNDTFGE